MAKTSPKQYAVALYEAAKDLSGKELASVLKDFVSIIARDHKLKQAGKIVEEFLHHGKKQEGIMEIEITSARELDDKTVEKIKNSFGDKVEATVKIDEEILGGIKIKTDDKILDGSLKTQLLKLKESII
ncbi:MAG: F1-ATP synthase, delta subunit [uncultured bacterium]|nr:MAG: F1-ATP synthase, delta subunit [uncultured bacterium]